MSDSYEQIVGVLQGPAAEARGCLKHWDFSSWQPDIICIRLLSNDVSGMNFRDSFPADSSAVIRGCLRLLQKVRACNPLAKIVWILPSSDSHPELGEQAVELARQEGLMNLHCFRLPDYGPEDFGARAHPNADWNRRAGVLLADFLKTLL